MLDFAATFNGNSYTYHRLSADPTTPWTGWLPGFDPEPVPAVWGTDLDGGNVVMGKWEQKRGICFTVGDLKTLSVSDQHQVKILSNIVLLTDFLVIFF